MMKEFFDLKQIQESKSEKMSLSLLYVLEIEKFLEQ
jgi:hypothetical protein